MTSNSMRRPAPSSGSRFAFARKYTRVCRPMRGLRHLLSDAQPTQSRAGQVGRSRAISLSHSVKPEKPLCPPSLPRPVDAARNITLEQHCWAVVSGCVHFVTSVTKLTSQQKTGTRSLAPDDQPTWDTVDAQPCHQHATARSLTQPGNKRTRRLSPEICRDLVLSMKTGINDTAFHIGAPKPDSTTTAQWWIAWCKHNLLICAHL
jgi:hypothetical protein